MQPNDHAVVHESLDKAGRSSDTSPTPSEVGSSTSTDNLSEIGTPNSFSSGDLASLSRRRGWKEVGLRALKGAGVGYGGPVVLGLVKLLVKFIKKGGKGIGLSDFWAVLTDVNNIQMGAFVGTMVSLYLGARVKLQDTQSRFKPALAGLLGGLALAIAPASSRANIGIFAGVRASEVVVKYAAQEGYVPTIPHADTLLSMLVSAEMIWAWVFRPASLDPMYLGFLDHQGAKSLAARHQICAITGDLKGYPGLDLAKSMATLMEERKAVGIFHPVKDIDDILHPHTRSKMLHYVQFLGAGLVRAAKMYGPLFGLQTILFRSASLMSNPGDTTLGFAKNVARSSLFLSMYCGNCWLAASICRDYLKMGTHHIGFIAGAAGGAATIVEGKGRRIELALYISTFALESTWNLNVGRGISLPFWEPVVFGLSLAALAQARAYEPTMVRGAYRNGLRLLLGNEEERPEDEEPPSFAPSKSTAMIYREKLVEDALHFKPV
jgi:hypothetical protein